MAEAPKKKATKTKTDGEVHDLEEERKERSNFLVRGAKAVSRKVRKTRDKAAKVTNKASKKVTDTVRKHPYATTFLASAAATYAARMGWEEHKERRDDRREELVDEISQAHLAQHDALLDAVTEKGIAESVREAFADEREKLISEMESGPWKAANKAAKEVAERYEKRLAESA